MADRFATCLAITLKHEGGKFDHPRDPGGRTNKGITWRVYNAWRDRQGLPRRDVYLITDDEVRAIYRAEYWDKVRGDELPPGPDVATFDAGVNSGIGRGGKWLRQALGRGSSTAPPSSEDARAARQAPDPVRLAARICDLRLSFVRGLRTFDVFGRGWTRRIADIRARAMAMAGATTSDLVAEADAAERRAVTASRQAAAGGAGAVASGGGAVVLPTAPTAPPAPAPEAVPTPPVVPPDPAPIDAPLTLDLGAAVPWLLAALALGLLGAVVWRLWRARAERDVAAAARAVAGELSAEGGPA